MDPLTEGGVTPQKPAAISEKLASALQLAERGFRVFPCEPNKRTPAAGFTGWSEAATTDPETIRLWFTGFYKNHNVGIATGKGVVALDFDVKDGNQGLRTLSELHDLWGLPWGYRTQTPSGGMHVLLRVPDGGSVPGSVKAFANEYPGLDVRGEGNLVIGPGSSIDGVPYVDLGGAWEDCPEFLLDAFRSRQKRHVAETREPLIELDSGGAVAQATFYLQHTAPEAVEGSGGDQTTYTVAAEVREIGVSEAMCFNLMAEHWNEAKAFPPWDLDDLQAKVGNAYRYATGAWGGASALAEFDAVDIAAAPNPAKASILRDGDWPEPTNWWSADSDPPGLPLGILPDLLERFARDRGRRLGVEPTAVAAAALVAFSSLVHASNLVQVRQKNPHWTEGPTLWAMLIGPPGSNKSATLTNALGPVTALDASWAYDHARELARINDLRAFAAGETKTKAQPQTAPPPKRRRKIINDATTEAVAAILADNTGGLLLYNDELSAFFGGMDAYRQKGGRDRPFWLEAKEGKTFTVDRKTSGSIFVPRNAVSIIGGIQPDKMRLLARGLVDDGLLQRFWPVFLERTGDGADDYADSTLDAAVLEVARRMADGPQGTRYRFSPEAGQELLTVETTKRTEISRGEHRGAYSQFADKLPKEFARLALVFHLLEWYSQDNTDLMDEPPAIIDEITARRARLFLTEVVLSHAKIFYHRIVERGEAESHARWIAGYILAHECGSLRARDIDRAYHALKGAEKRPLRLAAMYELELEGWVRPLGSGDRDGRPSQWKVNPQVFDGRFAAIAQMERDRRLVAREAITAEARRRSASLASPVGL